MHAYIHTLSQAWSETSQMTTFSAHMYLHACIIPCVYMHTYIHTYIHTYMVCIFCYMLIIIFSARMPAHSLLYLSLLYLKMHMATFHHAILSWWRMRASRVSTSMSEFHNSKHVCPSFCCWSACGNSNWKYHDSCLQEGLMHGFLAFFLAHRENSDGYSTFGVCGPHISAFASCFESGHEPFQGENGTYLRCKALGGTADVIVRIRRVFVCRLGGVPRWMQHWSGPFLLSRVLIRPLSSLEPFSFKTCTSPLAPRTFLLGPCKDDEECSVGEWWLVLVGSFHAWCFPSNTVEKKPQIHAATTDSPLHCPDTRKMRRLYFGCSVRDVE